ncbi:hypothetical protein BGZ92_008670 [Podila epicladia]|nr:hypothetical protein BGZ92_008670 [Podila epicladia]
MELSTLLISFKRANEPWRTLAEAAYNSFHGHDISHIQIPSGEHLQGLRRILYDKAVSLVSKANLEPMDYYSLFTAMSGIIDLRASHVADLSGYCVQAPELLEVDPVLSNLLKDLSLHLSQGVKALSAECTRRALKAFDSQQSFLDRTNSGSTSSQPSQPQRALYTLEPPEFAIIDSPILPSLKARKLSLDSLKTPVLEQSLWNSDLERGNLPMVMLDIFMGIKIQNDMGTSDNEGIDIGMSGGGGEEDGDEGGEDHYRVYQPMIELVRYLTSSIEQGEFPKSKDSIVNHWKTCLECLSDNRLDLRTYETNSENALVKAQGVYYIKWLTTFSPTTRP